MTKKAMLVTAGGLLLCLLTFLLAAFAFQVAGLRLWLIGGALLLLWAAGLAFYQALGPRERPAAESPGLSREVDAAVSSAQKQMARGSRGRRQRISRLPVLLWMGPTGGAKTSTILNSGMDPELLAGAVERSGSVVPTESVALWYAQGTVVLEVGSPVVADADGWTRLLRHLRPARLAAIYGRGEQPPRRVVVCFGCDEFFEPGGPESVLVSARKLRIRLVELAGSLGIRIPVYVLFTRADRIPHFAHFARTLTTSEAQEMLGATLPIPEPVPSGLYEDTEAARLGDAFRQILHSLSLHRLGNLAREGSEAARCGAYEFPRELHKVSDLVVRFLVELSRPSQLHESPFVRGFYFTGMRAVLASEAVPPPARDDRGPIQAALGATTVFDPRRLVQSANANADRGLRERAEPVFVRRLLRDVILSDRAAVRLAAGGTHVRQIRRALLASAAVACLLLGIAFANSYAHNRAMLREITAAVGEAGSIPREPTDFAPVEDLTRLEALRKQAVRLDELGGGRRPWRYRWGLYAGSAVRPAIRTLYFDRFSGLLWRRTRSQLVSSLESLPDAPTGADEYGNGYAALKAYLVTTSHPEQSSGAFLGPVLARLWTEGQETDAGRRELARRQFEYFGDAIPYGHPFADRPREDLVGHTRAYLAQFAEAERSYAAMLASASRAGEEIHFNRLHPAAAAVLRNDFVVPGAFTRGGWDFVKGNASAVEQLFSREEWVLGRQAISGGQRADLARELRARYEADYVRTWQQFLASASVVAFEGVGDGAEKLVLLSGNDSPLLRMLALVADHTDVDSAAIGQVFQPVRQVVPARAKDRLLGDSNQAYFAALGDLQSALGHVAAGAGAPPAARAQLLMQAMVPAAQAEGEARKLAQRFRVSGEARAVSESVQRLLLAPVMYARGVVSAGMSQLPTDPPPGASSVTPAAAGESAAGDLNRRGELFCRAVREVTRKFPFTPTPDEASLDELSGLLQPGNSVLSEFYDASLKALLRRQGSRYLPRLGATPVPSEAFVDFFNRAAALSAALYGESGTRPELQIALRPVTTAEIPEVSVLVEGKTHRFTRTMAASEPFVWRGSPTDVRLAARVNGGEVIVASERGVWALFRVFHQATWEKSGDGGYIVRWRVPGAAAPLSAQVVFESGVPVLDPTFLGGLGCVSRVTN